LKGGKITNNKMAKNLIGNWAFLIGIVLALVAGILAAFQVIDLTNVILASVLMALGAIIGLLNISRAETTSFMMSGTVVIIASTLAGGISAVVPGVSVVLAALLFIVVPAVIIVAIKTMFGLAKK
jgi:hypothetical protein